MINVYLYLPETMADWEIGFVSAELSSRRFFAKNAPELTFQTCALSKAPVRTMGGLTILPDRTVSDIIPGADTVLLLPGSDRWNDPAHAPVLDCAEKILEAGGTVAAICGAVTALAFRGILNDRRHTANGTGFLEMFVPNYTGTAHYIDTPAVEDGGLITAGAHGALDWARLIIQKIGVFKPETLTAWYNYFSTGRADHFYALMNSLDR